MAGELEPGRFFLPGPTEVDPAVLQAQAAPLFGHRGDEARALLAEVDRGLRPLFGTDRPVLVGTLSATGFMEAAIRCGVRRRVLCVVNGAFSERFAEIAEGCGREVERLGVPWGEAVDPQRLDDRLAAGGFDAVTLVHSETSTGALNSLPAIAEVLRRHDDVLALVDSVTGVGGVPMHGREWSLDAIVTGSQKALAMPPGLAFAAVSERLLERARRLPDRGWYLDLVRFAEQAELDQTPTTPALTLLLAAREQVRRIAVEGVEARFARHAAMAARCHAWAASAPTGIEIPVPPGARSPTLTCLRLPPGRLGPDVVAALRRRGFVIGAGYGPWKAATVRIGHMGDHTLEELEAVLEALGDVLASTER